MKFIHIQLILDPKEDKQGASQTSREANQVDKKGTFMAFEVAKRQFDGVHDHVSRVL